MATFSIDSDNNITALANPNAASTGTEIFSTQKQLSALAQKWPIARLVEIWNSFAGAPPFGDLKPVKKFENRDKAVSRIWKACEVLASELPKQTEPQAAAKPATSAAQAPKAAPARARAPKASTASANGDKGNSKTALIIGMLQAPGGATLNAIMTAAGWQAHSVRGFIAGAVKKLGYQVASTKSASGERTYAIEASRG